MSLRLRRGGLTGAEPPPPETYGPLLGAQWVRDNAATQAVTNPGGTLVTVNPGSLNQALLTANPGARFWITKGTHTITASLTPTNNQKFYLESAASSRTASNTAVLDAGNADLSGYILGTPQGNNPYVEVRGGVWKNLGGVRTTQTDNHRAPIRNFGNVGWLVEDAEIGPSNQLGIRFSGNNFICRRNYIHDCGFYGLNTIVNDGSYRMTNGLVEHNHLKANSKSIHGTTNDAGQKFGHIDSSTFRYNWVELQEGAGLWWDHEHKNHLIHDNVLEDNWDWGLFYEFSFGGTEIRNNYLRNNAEHYGTDSWFSAVQLLIGSTDATLGSPIFPEVRVHHNLLDGISKQMGILENAGRPHPKGMRFYDNDVTWRGTQSVMELAGGESNDTTEVYTNGNTFEGNRYHATNMSLARWQWIGASGSAGASKDWTQWKAYGHDDPGGLFDGVV